ncbi:acyltransferase [Stieleria sp. ICT_E10.1]|uniref:acyltransferase family protein n=1 Tax=Stieleria sedimenti TaxID=2976331 RepID=UPI00217F6548|nr:acyltransferase [Stieleria sedimenti]MCS7466485.1 acyltransferase [Stieleria sedimenti]
MRVIRLDQPTHPPSQSPPSTQPDAIVGFDALRAMAALAVVALHAGVPYARHPMPGLLWPVWDTSSRIVDGVFWSIEVIIMPLFLMMAGFLLCHSSRRHSPGRLIQSRAKRLLIPLAFGVVVILPISLYIWTAGLVVEGVVPAIKLKSLKFPTPISEQIWGLSHLWFLLYVFLYVVVAAGLIRAASRTPFARITQAVSRPKVLMAILVCVAVTTLAAAPQVVWGFQHAFLPVPSKWIYSGVFFAAGYGLAMHDRELHWVTKSSPRLLAIGVVLLSTSVLLGTWSLEHSLGTSTPNHAATFLMALLTVAAASTVTLGAIGASTRYITHVPRPIRYLASASFWIYLVHHPLLGLIHCDIKWLWPVASPLVKMSVSFLAATSLSLLMYESFVRRTRFGQWLGLSDRERPKPATVKTDQETTLLIPRPVPETETRRAA